MSELTKAISQIDKEKLIETWKQSGLLMGMPKEKIYAAAKALDDAANYFLYTKEHYNPQIETWVFPAISRICRKEGVENINIKQLISELNIQSQVINKKHWCTVGNKIDYEAKFLAEFCEKYVTENYKIIS